MDHRGRKGLLAEIQIEFERQVEAMSLRIPEYADPLAPTIRPARIEESGKKEKGRNRLKMRECSLRP